MTSKNKFLEKTSVCKNCNSTQINNYCSECGQIVQHKRFTLRSAFEIFIDAFSFEKGFFHTFIMLLTKPGVILIDSISGKTRPYANPLKYLLITASVYAFIFIYSGFFEDSMEMGNELFHNSNSTLSEINNNAQQNDAAVLFQNKIKDAVKDYLNLIPLLLIPFTSLATKWFYRKSKLLYGEFIILNTYISAQEYALVSLIILPIALFIPSFYKYATLLTGVISLGYYIFALHKSLKGSLILTIFKAISINIIGFILFFFLFMILMIIFVLFILISGISMEQLVGL